VFIGFTGKAAAVLDSKGRVHIPSRFMEVLTNHYDPNLVVSISDGCLAGYPTQEWKRLEEKLKGLASDHNTREIMRIFYSRVTVCPIRNGRILLPASLREHANLDKEVVLIGMGNKIEIWNKADWEKFEESHSGRELDEKLSNIPF
jgi:MraZ protein